MCGTCLGASELCCLSEMGYGDDVGGKCICASRLIRVKVYTFRYLRIGLGERRLVFRDTSDLSECS